jgi:hypothetical protein
VSIAALAALAAWKEWLNLTLGLWVLISPWALVFAQGKATKIHVLIGVIVAILVATGSYIKIRRDGRHPLIAEQHAPPSERPKNGHSSANLDTKKEAAGDRQLQFS